MVSREWLYCIRYEDGDNEHLTEEDVKVSCAAAMSDDHPIDVGLRRLRSTLARIQAEQADDCEEQRGWGSVLR